MKYITNERIAPENLNEQKRLTTAFLTSICSIYNTRMPDPEWSVDDRLRMQSAYDSLRDSWWNNTKSAAPLNKKEETKLKKIVFAFNKGFDTLKDTKFFNDIYKLSKAIGGSIYKSYRLDTEETTRLNLEEISKVLEDNETLNTSKIDYDEATFFDDIQKLINAFNTHVVTPTSL